MRMSWGRGLLKAWMGCGLVCVLAWPWAAGAVTNEWTGAGDNGLWSNAENWLNNEVPGEGSLVVFGNAAGNQTHAILVDGLYTNLSQISFSGGGDRQFNLSVDPETAEVALGLSHSTGVLLEEGLSHDVLFDVPFGTPTRQPGNFWVLRNDSDQRVTWGDLTWNSAEEPSGESPRFLNGRHALAGSYSGARNRVYLTADEVAFLPGFALLSKPVRARTPGMTLLFATDATLNRELEHNFDEGAFYIKGVDAGSGDRTVTIARRMAYLAGSMDTQMIFLENDEQDSGRFLLRLAGSDGHGDHTLPVDTREHTVIEIRPAVAAALTSPGGEDQPAMVISGEGSLWKSNAGTLNVYSENTYLGRTMISEGSLKLGAVTFGEGETARTFTGQLPSATIVELGADAVFNLNGIDQTVGGLTGWRGLDLDAAEATFGTVALSNAALTVAAQADSEFGGVIEGPGVLVKAGAGTFTLAADYTNVAGRTLRGEGGLLAVSGALAVEEGAFELAGGRITADSLAAADVLWNITLHEANEGEVLVAVTTAADITNAELNLNLAGGYAPVYGTEYTLLYAGTLTGAGEGGLLFGLQDGESFVQNGQEYEIRWKSGSEQIILTAIPEPGSLALLALMVGGLLLRRRRNG